MKKAIVFGGAGFVGSHVADALSARSIEVTVFDLEPSRYLTKNQTFIQGNVLDAEKVQNAIKGMHYVYNFAGQADIDVGIQNPSQTLAVNIQGTTNILEACKVHSIERFVFASSVYVYSDAGGFYRVSKQSCELIIEEYERLFQLPYTILRYGSLYGPRSDLRNFIHHTLRQAIHEKKILVDCALEDQREFIHVLDAAQMSVDALNTEYKNTHVMLTGFQKISRLDLLNTIKEILNNEIQIVLPNNLKDDRLNGHYKLTPYLFQPKLCKKMVSKNYIDLGQGLLNLIEEMYDKTQEKTANEV